MDWFREGMGHAYSISCLFKDWGYCHEKTNVTRAARRKAVQHFDLFDGQTALCPGLLKSGAAQHGGADGRLNEVASVGQGCLLGLSIER